MRTSSAWARSGKRPTVRQAAWPTGSWAASIARARASFDGLTGGPGATWDGTSVPVVPYSEAAAAAILACAVALWSDTARALDGDGLDETADMGTD
jgi:hypothetical protein